MLLAGKLPTRKCSCGCAMPAGSSMRLVRRADADVERFRSPAQTSADKKPDEAYDDPLEYAESMSPLRLFNRLHQKNLVIRRSSSRPEMVSHASVNGVTESRTPNGNVLVTDNERKRESQRAPKLPSTRAKSFVEVTRLGRIASADDVRGHAVTSRHQRARSYTLEQSAAKNGMQQEAPTENDVKRNSFGQVIVPHGQGDELKSSKDRSSGAESTKQKPDDVSTAMAVEFDSEFPDEPLDPNTMRKFSTSERRRHRARSFEVEPESKMSDEVADKRPLSEGDRDRGAEFNEERRHRTPYPTESLSLSIICEEDGLTRGDLRRLEMFYGGRGVSIHVCSCTAKLYKTTACDHDANAQSAIGEGVPLLLRDDGSEPRVHLVLAELSSGFPIWRSEVDFMSGWRARERATHTLYVMAVSGGSQMLRICYANESAANQFLHVYNTIKYEIEDQRNGNFSTEKKKLGFRKISTEKPAISSPCNFRHVTKISPDDIFRKLDRHFHFEKNSKR